MWIPVIVLMLMIVMTSIILSMLVKREKLILKGKRYRIIEILGIYIPLVVMCIYYAYLRTDVAQETLRVAMILLLGVFLITLEAEVWREHRFNYVILPLVMLTIFLLLTHLNRYLLSKFSVSFILGIIGSLVGSHFTVKNNRIKVLLSGGLVAIILLFMPMLYPTLTDTLSKPENVALIYVEDLGYEITADNSLFLYSSKESRTRQHPIEFTLLQVGDQYHVEHSLQMVYSKGEIVEFREIK